MHMEKEKKSTLSSISHTKIPQKQNKDLNVKGKAINDVDLKIEDFLNEHMVEKVFLNNIQKEKSK